MIKRIWHGWTSPALADRYERLLKEEIFPGIEAKGLAGYRGIELLRREGKDEVEFVTIMTLESADAARGLGGEDPEAAYVPPKAREVLTRFDEFCRHFELRDRRVHPDG